MSKKINAKSVAPQSLETLSNYNVAYHKICEIKAKAKAEIQPLQAKIDEIKESRKDALAKGMPLDEVTSKFNISGLQAQIDAINVRVEKECEPHKESVKTALSMWAEVGYAYELAMAKYNNNATGTLTRKVGKNEIKFDVEKSLQAQIKECIITLGFGQATNDKAVTKFVNAILTVGVSMQKSNKGDHLKKRGDNAIKEMLTLAIIKYCLDTNAWAENEDYTLSVVAKSEEVVA